MTNLPAFVLKIARNLCVNAKRKEKPTVLLEDYMAVHHDNRNDRDELLNLIKMALELLPEDYKEAFILREYEGLSYSDIAEMTDTPLSSVKIRIFRAKQRIREILQPYMSDLTSI
jgi:RNA polymerase sigma-70 factor (ECF subfamily)